MGEGNKDPAIKLFGKTIPLSDTPLPGNDVIHEDVTSFIIINNDDVVMVEDEDEEDVSGKIAPYEIDTTDKVDQDRKICHMEDPGVSLQDTDKSACHDPSLDTADNPGPLSGADEKLTPEPSKSEEEKAETNVPPEKTLKKPDKIIPCPRCNSMDTKFCYYNNYNVNQPRHFCRKCQRYWTAGGTMRNVPVGAGRRKNKNLASHYRQISVSEALQNNRTEIPNGVLPGLQTNSTVLAFGSDSPLCESMASILSLADQNGFQKQPEELKVQIPFIPMEIGGQLDGSNLEASTKSSPKETASQISLPYSPQLPCYPPWPYPWNSAQWSPPVAAPSFCPGGLAFPFYPAPPYWGCVVPGNWSNPWIAQPCPGGQSSPSSGPNSPTLGKHSRDGNMLASTSPVEKESKDTGCERSLWIPKTLRIDDPGEAAKSSIWTTLGIKNSEKRESIGRGSGLFKAFQSKCDGKTPNLDTSTMLKANPAALSRSQNFQESS